jgi:murein DD-endopeptidase MepM/ murein hydrolase activator NlpD
MSSNNGSFFKRAFPERQIYHRADGQVKYFTLSTTTQIAAATISALALGWTVYASASVILNGHMLSARSEESSLTTRRYEGWLAEARAKEAYALAMLQSRNAEFEKQAAEFERRHEVLKDLLMQATGTEVPGVGVRISDGADGDRVMVAAVPEDATPRISRVALRQTDSEPIGQDRVSALIAEQDQILTATEEAAQTRTESLRAIIRMTGVTVNEVVDEGSVARGGPFVPLTESASFREAFQMEDAFPRRVARVAARVAEAQTLQSAINSVPLAVPVTDDRAYFTSGFGFRTDPIHGRRARHTGLDMAAYHMAPIRATAPGKVSFAGWRSDYGQVVEIEHGHGFKTRYAHLAKMYVKRGDQIGIGEKIGGMGSTGRSTGTHLHYEVMFRNNRIDPARFLKAGKYVQQE